ncbi:histone H1.8 [Mixophyes fleayi]|uniref:histone H1.8 n=1 Tax=Mixophyes fleayi TaxID=3061075 RepID=UPI003F4D9388
MAPKKVPAASAAVVEKEEKKPVEENSKEKAKPVKLVKNLGHPPTLAMVIEVLKKNSERKGTSAQAIRTRILAAHPTVDPVRLKFLLRSALNKGIEKGILIRPANSSATGATGRFKLAKPGSKPKEAINGKMSENVDPNAEPKEKAKKPPKKAKVVKEKESKDGADEKAEKKVKAAGKKEKSEEKPKAAANKPKKDPEVKPDKAPAAPKKPKAKAAAEGGEKPEKEPAKKAAKAKPSKAKKEPEENSAPKKGKK